MPSPTIPVTFGYLMKTLYVQICMQNREPTGSAPVRSPATRALETAAAAPTFAHPLEHRPGVEFKPPTNHTGLALSAELAHREKRADLCFTSPRGAVSEELTASKAFWIVGFLRKTSLLLNPTEKHDRHGKPTHRPLKRCCHFREASHLGPSSVPQLGSGTFWGLTHSSLEKMKGLRCISSFSLLLTL